VPVSSNRRAETPLELDNLRPYMFHGINLKVGNTHGVGDCPFCGREGKFSVKRDTGLWRCFVCGIGTENGGGNALVFLRLFYEKCLEITARMFPESYTEIAQDRRLLSSAPLTAWGVCVDPGATWLIPGYGPDGKLDQLYRRIRIDGQWRLLPTPGVWREGKVHALHLPIKDFDPSRPSIDVCEGPWDGMTMWEVGRSDTTNIVAVPGCNVWRNEWTEMCRGKKVTLWFDSDHPRTVGAQTFRAGYDGMVRIGKRLSGVAASVRWMKWGEDGYNPYTPTGWDVRDELAGAATVQGRQEVLAGLLEQVESMPSEWCMPTLSSNGSSHTKSVEAKPCHDWKTCEAAWKDALCWRPDMSNALAVLLAVCASTAQSGNQLFLDLIGSPGGAKTTLCRALLVSDNCIHLENMTKLMSGFKKRGDGNKDCSFLARANNKTWVTCEFDTLSSSPQYQELMGKVRRIFDGETSATYGNSDEDRIYTALRTPWVRAGTPKMMDHDQSQLGDRFMRFILSDPDDNDSRLISRRALQLERLAMVEQSNCMAGSIVDPCTRLAYALTGGYIDWLRENVEGRLGQLQVSEEAEEYCLDLAELSAYLRARPQKPNRWTKELPEAHDYKELPTRLARQNIRLASCLAVVLNKSLVDGDILRIIKRVALDTACGYSRNIVEWMCAPNPRMPGKIYQECGGLPSNVLAEWVGMGTDRLTLYLNFLRKIGVLDFKHVPQTNGFWMLTQRVYDLYRRVKEGRDASL
jgi:hypothetical protein